MASANFLTVKNHLTEFKSNTDKDTVSEASESGTSNSVTSAEELQKFALILGLNSAEDVYQERFRVDRRRLEAMLTDTLDESQTAQAFFHRVMSETNTLIKWPTRLKVGARSKKDPHVRVAGKCENVRIARDKIMQLLDTRSNRVTMKIDVSYTDHSHIIGKGGQTIKRVMEETGCHIHFPDSNRTSATEKSNQVSIAGDMERVERARARVRALTPLLFSFELPVVAPSQPLPDLNSDFVQSIQDTYNVQVVLRNRPKLHGNILVVKGVQWEVQTTMDATMQLLNYMCGPLANQTRVYTTMEISPVHHNVVVGRNAEQLKTIMKGTNTQIMFPDAEDPNIPNIKKSCVIISGQIKDVYAARQQLLGSLPLVVIFDVAQESFIADHDTAALLMQKYNVFITIRHKPKQGITSIVLKGIERCAGDIYEVRRELLGLKEPSVTAEIPESYRIPAINANTMYNYSAFNPYSPSHQATIPLINSPCSPLNIASNYNIHTLTELVNYVNIGSPMYGHNPPTPGGYPSPLSPVAITRPMFPNRWLIPSPQPGGSQFHFPNPNVVFAANQEGSWSPFSCAESNMQQPPMMQPEFHAMQNDNRPSTSQMLNSSSQASSGYQSNFTGSCLSLDTQNISGGETSNVASPSVSPISKTHSPAPSTENDRSRQESGNVTPLPAERRAVGCEKKTLEKLNQLSPLADYRRMKAEAYKAMQEDVGSGYRVPNTRWSGHYFSHTSPGSINIKDANTAPMATPEKMWNRSELVRPNIAEVRSPRTAHSKQPCDFKALQDLLVQMRLEKYIELFRKHELDMSTFASLTDEDLSEIGVSAFGARRKMLLFIQEMKKRDGSFSGTADPGANRRVITSPKYTNKILAKQEQL